MGMFVGFDTLEGLPMTVPCTSKKPWKYCQITDVGQEDIIKFIYPPEWKIKSSYISNFRQSNCSRSKLRQGNRLAVFESNVIVI
jgi:hypothetical protein